jgi:hypothetical protein
MNTDNKAIQILFRTYWSSSGWISDNQRTTAADDLAYAKAAGVMFDPVAVTHDELVSRAVDVCSKVSQLQVIEAFLSSLTNRHMELRSALGSWAYLSHFRHHPFENWDKQCAICGWYGSEQSIVDLNVLNFERLKWGGVRHDNLLYVVFDLEQFRKLEYPLPSKQDIAIFRKILRIIVDLPEKTTAAALQKHLAPIIKSNKAERDILIDILGICGILQTEQHTGYSYRFTPYKDRKLPNQRFIDHSYPVCWWKAADGINQEVVTQFFGDLLCD